MDSTIFKIHTDLSDSLHLLTGHTLSTQKIRLDIIIERA